MQPTSKISQRAIEANRRNAQRSTGPKTEAGKAKSRQNATRHKITAQIALLPDEDRIAAEDFCAQLAATFRPESPEEVQLAQGIAENYWHLHQAGDAVLNRFALSLSGAGTFERDANALRLFSLYEQRTFNKIVRMKRELAALQKGRQGKRQVPIAKVRLINELRPTTAKPGIPNRQRTPGRRLSFFDFTFPA